MFPAAAVSGWYFAHPQAQYFAVGKIDKDQVERYSQRKGQEASVSERWLAPNLGCAWGAHPIIARHEAVWPAPTCYRCAPLHRSNGTVP